MDTKDRILLTIALWTSGLALGGVIGLAMALKELIDAIKQGLAG